MDAPHSPLARGVLAHSVDLVVTRDSERANALRAVPCVYDLNPVAFVASLEVLSRNTDDAYL